MRNLLCGRDNGPKHPDLSLHRYHYAPQNHAAFDAFPHLLATITLSSTGFQAGVKFIITDIVIGNQIVI